MVKFKSIIREALRRKKKVSQLPEEEEKEKPRIPSFEEILYRNAGKWVIMLSEGDDIPTRNNVFYMRVNDYGEIDLLAPPIPVPRSLRARAIIENVYFGHNPVILIDYQTKPPMVVSTREGVFLKERLAKELRDFIFSIERRKGMEAE